MSDIERTLEIRIDQIKMWEQNLQKFIKERKKLNDDDEIRSQVLRACLRILLDDNGDYREKEEA